MDWLGIINVGVAGSSNPVVRTDGGFAAHGSHGQLQFFYEQLRGRYCSSPARQADLVMTGSMGIAHVQCSMFT